MTVEQGVTAKTVTYIVCSAVMATCVVVMTVVYVRATNVSASRFDELMRRATEHDEAMRRAAEQKPPPAPPAHTEN